ncbi:MAG: histidine kinase [Flavobacterium sp.]|jgi:sensor histidine kinase YesM|uniref:sensor histidine kinase n=2 Tax=Flavobacterium sp. TaxID=239 RepID=UPI0022C4AA9F|nr:histidine kinase [Flavobacterium sp.]MCZ8298493.1 histidine kinase [Flavobacterium sp.]
MRLRVLYHLAFWSFFILLFWQQNPDANTRDILTWFILLGVSASVVYANLYILFPNYFFKRNYLVYLLLLVLTIGLGAFILWFIIPSANANFNLPLFQHFINLFFIVVITSSFKFFREYLRKQALLIKVENEQLKTELALLKSQVNPHFLFNTLNNLYGLITQNQNQQASDVTLKLADLMRYLLESSKTDLVNLNKEIQFIDDYLSLEKIRLSQKTDINFTVSGMNKELFVAPLLFIPLVENAFKHGLNTILADSFAHFSLSVQGNELFFEAINSVEKSTENSEKSGTGLENLKKRLQLIYPQKHQLDIEQTSNQFKVILHIQL